MAKGILMGQDSLTINETITTHMNDTTKHMTTADRTKIDGIAAGATKTTITNNLTTTTPGTALDATQGKILKDMIIALQTVEFYVDIEGEGADGITITATCGSTVVKGTTDANGKCVLRSSVLGTYNIAYSSDLTFATARVVANSYGIYNISGQANITYHIGYLMLYDEGDECVDVTGGWRASSGNTSGTTATKNANSLYVSTDKYNTVVAFLTARTFDLNAYAQIGGTMKGVTANTEQYGFICTYTVANPVYDTTPQNQNAANTANKKVYIGNIENSGNQYMGFYTGNDRACYLYNMFLFKSDDWQTWLTKAGLNPSSYANLDTVLSNASAMAVLGNSTEAINYMTQYSGTIMGGVLNNDTAFNAMSTAAKQKMAANPHWVKFADIFDRTL